MKIFKAIEIDLDAERERIKRPRLYNKRQRAALIELYNLFEAGEWQKCLDLVNDVTMFPYNDREEYYETEHICSAVSNTLMDLFNYNIYTQEQLKNEIKELLSKGN